VEPKPHKASARILPRMADMSNGACYSLQRIG